MASPAPCPPVKYEIDLTTPMRLQGQLTEWNDERGFGFVAQNGTGQRFFLHISQLASRGTRPSVGEMLTFEVGEDEKGRRQARNARRVGERAEHRSGSGMGAVVMVVVLLVALGYLAYVRVSARGSTLSAAVYKNVFARDALRAHPEFQCSPEKNSCSKMTSCAEALFHLERCGVPGMDGDRDGIPCEQQWCR